MFDDMLREEEASPSETSSGFCVNEDSELTQFNTLSGDGSSKPITESKLVPNNTRVFCSSFWCSRLMEHEEPVKFPKQSQTARHESEPTRQSLTTMSEYTSLN